MLKFRQSSRSRRTAASWSPKLVLTRMRSSSVSLSLVKVVLNARLCGLRSDASHESQNSFLASFRAWELTSYLALTHDNDARREVDDFRQFRRDQHHRKSSLRQLVDERMDRRL